MKIDILTLFPEMFRGPFDESIIKRAKNKKLVEINIHNLRDWAKDKHKTVDDRPFGGGTGMVLKIDVLYVAIKKLRASSKEHKAKTILLTPQGKTFNQKMAQKMSELGHLILICGHYEGVDERVRKHLVDEEISIGDFVLTGGELPAMVVTDAITRLIPKVLKKPEAAEDESFSEICDTQNAKRLLEYPQYTRPAEFMGWKVPKVLLSGNHAEIKKWQQKQALKRTKSRRPDLL